MPRLDPNLRKRLTRRQTEVVRLMSLGCTVKEIAAILAIFAATVGIHKAAAMRTMGTRKSALLTRLAFSLGITSRSDKLSPAEATAGPKAPCEFRVRPGWELPLTQRQKAAIRLISLGCDADETAAILNISIYTVDYEQTAIGRILGTRKPTMLTRYAIMSEISPLGDELTASEKRRCGIRRSR